VHTFACQKQALWLGKKKKAEEMKNELEEMLQLYELFISGLRFRILRKHFDS
jgi:hypothetical protein